VHGAPCNPSDIAFMEGGYNIIKALPAVPGFEGSGRIVEAGEGAEHLIGSKVSFFVQAEGDGSWSEYVCTHAGHTVILDEAMDLDQAACFALNPFTARGLLDIALLRNDKAIIQNAAGGQVAAFVRQMAAEMNIEVIDIVRKDESRDQLLQQGAKHVLLESDEDFDAQLIDLSHQLGARLAFDAVGGKLSGQIFNAMPENAELVVYGGLSTKDISGVSTMDLIFKDKVISGFNLPHWRNQLDDDYFEEISHEMQQHFISGKYKTRIQGATDYENIVQGLINYIRKMSEGKILIKPSL
jgi:NADPH:quinone reductase-like Zn-dependent oxidoreductase